jgi:hypothetical protein
MGAGRDQPGRAVSACRLLPAAATEGATWGVVLFYHALYSVFSDVSHMTVGDQRKCQRAMPDRYPGTRTCSPDIYIRMSAECREDRTLASGKAGSSGGDVASAPARQRPCGGGTGRACGRTDAITAGRGDAVACGNAALPAQWWGARALHGRAVHEP